MTEPMQGRTPHLAEMARRVYAAQQVLSDYTLESNALITLGEAFETAAPGSAMDTAAGILLSSRTTTVQRYCSECGARYCEHRPNRA